LPGLGASRAGLAPGASAADLAKFEARTKLVLPAEVRAFWRGHDGEKPRDAGLAGGFLFLSSSEAAKAVEVWKATREELGSELKALDRPARSRPPKAIRRVYSSPGWVPLLSDREGNHVGVDLDPGTAGVAGQVINFGRDEEEKYVLFPTAVELLEWLASELEAGRIVYDKAERRVKHVGGRLVGVLAP
jgi:cell wall assembly regulator SMI1